MKTRSIFSQNITRDTPIAHMKSMVSCQKGPTRHAYAWQIGPFWQDTLETFVSFKSDLCSASATVVL